MMKQNNSDHSLSYAIGIDLGGTKIEIGLVDNTGYVHYQQRLETLASEGYQAVQQQIVKSILKLKQQAQVKIKGVGIGAAGQIHPQTGEIIFSPNLKWHHVPLKSDLESALNLPVQILNDVRAITWGEWQYGAGRGVQDLVCAFIGTGVGAGVVSGNRLLKGASHTFGEIGHMTVDFKGPLCSCGKKGCLEVFASGWGIAARAQEAYANDPEEKCIQTWTARKVIEAYRHQDKRAVLVIEQAKQVLIAGFASLINIYNPSRLILGGGLLEGLPELIEEIQIGIKQTALKAATCSLKVVKSSLGAQGGLIGSAAAVLNLKA